MERSSSAVAHARKGSEEGASNKPVALKHIDLPMTTSPNSRPRPDLYPDNSGQLLHKALAHGADTPSTAHSTSFDYPNDCSFSCPERLEIPRSLPTSDHSGSSRSFLGQRLLLSLSRTPSSGSLRSRLASRFSHRPHWNSSPGSSLSPFPNISQEELGTDEMKFPTGKERRRRARESERHRRSFDDELLELESEEGTRPLAMAAVALAAADLERLSSMAAKPSREETDKKEAGSAFAKMDDSAYR
ncbi:hypothetical protein BGZ63DRAFT_399505 [Mariannaea sp. PMI_226]|nr:hypothetical protein BGZ63DRAFT_399505 [Mariannaea sp. PMI_226]